MLGVVRILFENGEVSDLVGSCKEFVRSIRGIRKGCEL